MYSCFVHLLYLDRLSWANVIKWKGSLRSPSLFTPDLIVVVLSIYIRRELRSLETYSKRRYKICICLVIPREFEAFRNLKGYSVIFSKSLDVIERFTKVIIFLIPLSSTFLNPTILGFFF